MMLFIYVEFIISYKIKIYIKNYENEFNDIVY